MPLITDPALWVRALAQADLPPMVSPDPPGEGFRGGLATGRLGAVRLAEFVTPAGRCYRDEPRLRERDQDLCQIYLYAEGRSRIEQGGRRTDLADGDLAVIDPGRPLEVTTTAARYVTLLVPRPLLGIDPSGLDRLAGTRLTGTLGSGAMLASVVRTAVTMMDALTDDEADRCGRAVVELLGALCVAQLPRQAPDPLLRTRIQTYVIDRLSDRDLGPTTIAAAHHISVRRLHQLFRNEPRTVAALIRHHRLERCREDLRRPRTSIIEISARWGFDDPAHFSRLFRKTYGVSPSEYRRMR